MPFLFQECIFLDLTNKQINAFQTKQNQLLSVLSLLENLCFQWVYQTVLLILALLLLYRHPNIKKLIQKVHDMLHIQHQKLIVPEQDLLQGL
jgi:hypothetical protein